MDNTSKKEKNMNNSYKKQGNSKLIYDIEDADYFLQINKFLEQLKQDYVNIGHTKKQLTNHISRPAIANTPPIIGISVCIIIGLIVIMSNPSIMPKFVSTLIWNLEEFSSYIFTISTGIILLIVPREIYIRFKKWNDLKQIEKTKTDLLNLKLKNLQHEVIRQDKKIQELQKKSLTNKQIDMINYISEYLENLENSETAELHNESTKEILYKLTQMINELQKKYADLTNTSYDDIQKLSDENQEKFK